MKTCPTCLGEGKVRDSIRDSAPEIRKSLLYGAKTVGQVAVVLAIAAGCPAFMIGVARAICWAINEPLTTRSFSGDTGANGLLIAAAIVGTLGGLVLTSLVTIEFSWRKDA